MPKFICDHPASYDAGLCCGKTPCALVRSAVAKINIPFEQVFAEAMGDPETRAHYDKLQAAKEIRGHLPPGEPRVGTRFTEVTFGEASVDLPLLSEQQQAELRAFLRVVYEAGRQAAEDDR